MLYMDVISFLDFYFFIIICYIDIDLYNIIYRFLAQFCIRNCNSIFFSKRATILICDNSFDMELWIVISLFREYVEQK